MIKLTVGQKITVFSISEMMGNTQKREIVIKSVCEPVARLHYSNGPIDGYKVGTFSERGKRKEFVLTLRLDALVFDGWDLPIKTDFDVPFVDGSKSFRGNACFNFCGDAGFIREMLENKNLNGPTSDEVKAKCILCPVEAGCRVGSMDDEGVLLYPELEANHGVISRMKEKTNA